MNPPRLQRASPFLWALWTGTAVAAAVFYGRLSPNERFAVGTLGLFLLVKTTMWFRMSPEDRRSFSRLGRFLFLTIWPGMDPAPLRERLAPQPAPEGAWKRGAMGLAGGISLGALSCFLFRKSPDLASWMLMFAFLLFFHFGVSEIIPAVMRRFGWPVSPLFRTPLMSRSLQDFWGRRWNLAFVEMDKILFLPWLKARLPTLWAVFGIFVISGLLHDMAVSYPAGGRWGLPTIYFVLHGTLVLLEGRSLKPERWPSFAARVWTAAWILIPLPLLFHAPFREAFLGRLLSYTHSLWIQ